MDKIKEITLRFKYLCEYNYNYCGNFYDWLFEHGYVSEMSNLPKRRSGLTVNLWVDDNGSYKKGKHGKRIKFQLNNANNVQETNMGVMTISDDPEVIINPKQKIEISQKEINAIKEFVIKHKSYLEDLADMKIDFGDFLEMLKNQKSQYIVNVSDNIDIDWVISSSKDY
jgi:hypothetical protein